MVYDLAITPSRFTDSEVSQPTPRAALICAGTHALDHPGRIAMKRLNADVHRCSVETTHRDVATFICTIGVYQWRSVIRLILPNPHMLQYIVSSRPPRKLLPTHPSDFLLDELWSCPSTADHRGRIDILEFKSHDKEAMGSPLGRLGQRSANTAGAKKRPRITSHRTISVVLSENLQQQQKRLVHRPASRLDKSSEQR